MKMKSLFYGWLVLASAFIIFAVVTIGVNGLPLLNVSLKEIFGWTHEQVTRGPSVLYFVVAIVSPFAGALVDRFGPRLMMGVGSLLTVLALLLYPHITEPWHLVGIYVLCAASITLGGAIAGVTLLSYWFNRYRGIAVGIYLVGSSLGGIVFPQLIAALTQANGWQKTALILAAVAVLLAVVPLLLVRNRPAEKNTVPDGQDAPVIAGTNAVASSDAGNLTLADALGNPMFYLVLYVTAAVFFCITGVVQNFALFMRDVGLNDTQTANALSLFFICSIAGKLIFGALSDRFSKKSILVAAVVNMTIGSVLMRFIPHNSDIFLPLFAVIYGLGYSGAFTMVQLTVAEYYAGKNFGKILGVVTTMDTLAGSAGIYLLGTLRTMQGDYLTGIHILIGVSVSAVLCALLIRRPQAVALT
ncbi:MFS transporter [Rhodoflexus caldus]|uniref:MFS transporter n=1 Tax=Rhodoflexus caldus TaxID=2891236 RepID=UPI00202A1C86|nr:MFS transporter [Rhodoflexus caldus]